MRAFLLFLVLASVFRAPGQTIEPVTIVPASTPGFQEVTWPAYSGSTYYLQTSPDLENWTSNPSYVIGNDMLHSIFLGGADPLFARLISYVGLPTADNDGDGLSNHYETTVSLTDPSRTDTDSDGASDGEEAAANTDPNDAASGPAFVVKISIPPVANEMQIFLDAEMSFIGDNSGLDSSLPGSVVLVDPQNPGSLTVELWDTATPRAALVDFRSFQPVTTQHPLTLLNVKELWVNTDTDIEVLNLEIPANGTQSPAETGDNAPLPDSGGYGTWKIMPVELLADTDRNGDITGKDSAGKELWTNDRGAIYAVNFDNDDSGIGDIQPDAIAWWAFDGVPSTENWIIENVADEADITPLQVRIPDLPIGSKVFLTLSHLEHLHAIHVFGEIKSGNQAIWGGILMNGRPWSDPDSNPLDIEITDWLNPNPGTSASVAHGVYHLGVEGLAFRGMKIPNGALTGGRFAGVIDFGLEIQLPDSPERLQCGEVKMKVAPFLLTLNDRPTDKVFVREVAKGLMAPPNNMPEGIKLKLEEGCPTQWTQDHAEIGYTQRPGGPLTKMTFVCPYQGNILATWPIKKLNTPDKGIFALGTDLLGGSGDYGGNIELAHPDGAHPLGRIIVGDQLSSSLKTFLEAQEVQPLVKVDVNFTELKHIDEVVSIGPNELAYVPDPAGAIALLQEKFDTVEKQKGALFFSPDTQAPLVAKVWRNAFGPTTKYLVTDLDYDAVIGDWQRLNGAEGGYLRLVGGGSGGQVAKIKSLSKATLADATKIQGNDNPTGKLMIEVERFHDTGAVVNIDWKIQTPVRDTSWYRTPSQGAHIVCVKNTLFWNGTTPSIMTVWEALQDVAFMNFNQTALPVLIQGAVEEAGGTVTVGLPSLFYRQGPQSNPTAIAYTPNTANLQWVNLNPVHPDPFGPRNISGTDVLRERIQNLCLGQVSTFLDDWSIFHLQSGEVHCGSNAERQAEPFWWEK